MDNVVQTKDVNFALWLTSGPIFIKTTLVQDLVDVKCLGA